MDAGMAEQERIQKLLSRAGYGSRREIERQMEAGLVTVNDKVVKPGEKASVEDTIKLRGELVHLSALKRFHARVIAYHKPIGEVVSRSDEKGRDNVFNHIPKMATSRWISVGRLDINTSGLLLFTNDGELANKLMHPSGEVEREYAVRVLGEATPEMLKQLRDGVELDDGMASFSDIQDAGGSGANRWYHVVLAEGRNREVRRLWEAVGLQVSRLMRVRYGPLMLGRDLKQGKWRDLLPREMKTLYEEVGMKPPQEIHHKQPKRRKKHNPWK